MDWLEKAFDASTLLIDPYIRLFGVVNLAGMVFNDPWLAACHFASRIIVPMSCVCLVDGMFCMQAKASQQQGTLVARELHKQAYQDALVQRYQHMPEIRRITRHRHLPVPLYKVMHPLLFTHLGLPYPACF